MSTITYLPHPKDLEEVYEKIPDDAEKKRNFKELAKKVLEHSDQVAHVLAAYDAEESGEEQ